MRRRWATTNVTIWLLSLAAVSLGENRELRFDDGWDVSGEDSRLETYLGRTSLRMRSGRAIRRDVRLEDGIIELDVAVTGDRSFFYVQFRMESDGDHEELYFRPHKSGLPDAIQYTPVYRGEGNWQLYHGPGFTAPAVFPKNEWIHIRIALDDGRVAVWVGDVGEPQLVVARLARASRAGYVAVRSFLPGGQPEDIYPTSFSNVTVDSNPDAGAVPEAAISAPPEGIVSEWLVSEPFSPAEGAVTSLPEVDGFSTLHADDTGLLVLGRLLQRPGRGRASVVAKLTLTSQKAQTVPFHLGFSDEVSVFYGGRLLVSLDQSYSFDVPRREGLIGLDQATLYLPLLPGDNELLLAITDVFGGWGVMGRIEAKDVAVSAR